MRTAPVRPPRWSKSLREPELGQSLTKFSLEMLVMKVQCVVIPDRGDFTWLLLDDEFLPVKPVCSFLAYLDNPNVRRTPYGPTLSTSNNSGNISGMPTLNGLRWSSPTCLSSLPDCVALWKLPPQQKRLHRHEEVRRLSTPCSRPSLLSMSFRHAWAKFGGCPYFGR